MRWRGGTQIFNFSKKGTFQFDMVKLLAGATGVLNEMSLATVKSPQELHPLVEMTI